MWSIYISYVLYGDKVVREEKKKKLNVIYKNEKEKESKASTTPLEKMTTLILENFVYCGRKF